MRIACVLIFVLVALATAGLLPVPSYACKIAKVFDVPESAFHMYEALAWKMTRRLSVNRRPIFHLQGIRRIRWLNKHKNTVSLHLTLADSTCRTWPKNFGRAKCRVRPNSARYACTGWALVKNGLQLRKFVKTTCKKIPWKRSTSPLHHLFYNVYLR